MEEFEASPDWCMIPRISDTATTLPMNGNVTNENKTNRSPDRRSSSSIEVIDEEEETFKDETHESSENLIPDLSGNQNIDDTDKDVPEHAMANNLENLIPQQFTENSVTTAAATEASMSNNKVTKRKVIDSRNHNQFKKSRMAHPDRLITQDIENLMTMLMLLLTVIFIYLVNFCFGGESNSQLSASIKELKEENKLFREELSNFMRNESSAMDLMLQKLVEKLENQSLPSRKEFDELKEQVKNVKTDIKMFQDQVSGGSNKRKIDASKLFSREVLESRLKQFFGVVSGLYKRIFSLDKKSQEKIPDEKISSSDSKSKPSNFSKTNPDKTKVLEKLLKDLQNVMSNCIPSFKSYGAHTAEFLKKVHQRIKELIGNPNSDTEVTGKNLKIFQDLLVKFQNIPECMNIIKEKKLV